MKRFGILVLLVLLTVSVFSAEIVLNFWHGMSGSRMTTVNELCEGFNKTHPGIRVVPQFTGSYAETLTKAIAAVRGGNPPHIVQVYEVGFQTMFDSNAIVPLYEFADPNFDFGDVVVPILDYYSVDGSFIRCRSTRLRLFCTIIRTPSKKPASIRTNRLQPLKKSTIWVEN